MTGVDLINMDVMVREMTKLSPDYDASRTQRDTGASLNKGKSRKQQSRGRNIYGKRRSEGEVSRKLLRSCNLVATGRQGVMAFLRGSANDEAFPCRLYNGRRDPVDTVDLQHASDLGEEALK